MLNTDNINITGESFDYGPWRFLPTYDPGFTAAYFDETGLYAFGRQPATLLWNLTRLAECLLPLAPQAELEAALRSFQPAFQRRARRGGAAPSRPALGRPGHGRRRWSTQLFDFLESSRAPFEQTFFDWRGGLASTERAAGSPSAELLRGRRRSRRYGRRWLDFEPATERAWTHPYFAATGPARC